MVINTASPRIAIIADSVNPVLCGSDAADALQKQMSPFSSVHNRLRNHETTVYELCDN